MILTCNSCEKKFVVPDSAIGASGRLVQCSSCGNKWKQFPIKSNEEKSRSFSSPISNLNKRKKIIKSKKRVKKKKAGPNLYTPEYLSKKHGIIIDKDNLKEKKLILKIRKLVLDFIIH